MFIYILLVTQWMLLSRGEVGSKDNFFSCRGVTLNKWGKVEGIFPTIFFHSIWFHVVSYCDKDKCSERLFI